MSEHEFLELSQEAAAIIDRLEYLRKDCVESHEAAMAEIFKEAA